jgi:hypothetical protein
MGQDASIPRTFNDESGKNEAAQRWKSRSFLPELWIALERKSI